MYFCKSISIEKLQLSTIISNKQFPDKNDDVLNVEYNPTTIKYMLSNDRINYGVISKKCNICKKVSKRLINIKDVENNFKLDTCFLYKNRKCFLPGIKKN